MSQKARDIVDRIRGRFKRMMLRRRMRKKSEFGDWGNSGPMVPDRATDDHIADVAPDEVQTTAIAAAAGGEGGGGGGGGSRIIINEPAPNLNDVRIEYPEPYDLGTVRTSELAPNLNDVRIASFASNDLRTAVIAVHEPDPEPEPEPQQREPATTTRVPQVRFQDDHEASSEYSSLRDSEELIRGNMGTRPDVVKPLNINRENRQEEPYLSTHLGVPRTNAYQVSPGTERHSALSQTFNFDPTSIDRVDENITENPPVTHETVFPHVHEIREEQIYRDIHTYDHYHYVQPVYDLEVLPARHFAPAADGQLREVSARDLPECTGANQKWSIMENESVNAKRQAEIPRVIN
ncbi:hypothetical protein PFICI_06842 [Pestalotiopsis fici W106-1]|uniref:Uncharacterized protein n=1 Tax=Pestalotiopsis fici (strain W106-1 / CGMCC3.15140) TaxID=1229662 RepID=W3X713_PESFW|nr:uncharacterized protein PFICI_06842 [Pestalotiopsis fici W106-1]ETS81840.1 hypothetical protein PFICI_06842 [Pestalotiopsis fici W106-1]